MGRRIGSLLVAVGLATSLQATQAARALQEPAYDCGFVAYEDQFNQNHNWHFVEWAYIAGVPAVHTEVAITCWLENGLGQVLGGTVSCTEISPATACAAAEPKTFGLDGEAFFWCVEAEWYDHVSAAGKATLSCTPVEF